MQNPTPEIPESRIAQFKKISFKEVPNPAFIIHTDLLKANGQILKGIKEKTGAKILLAQKGFSCFSTYPILREFLDGTSSSGFNEALLAKEHFGKEIHIYSPAFTSKDVVQLASFCDTIIFNSMQQLAMGITATEGQRRPEFGLRINPQFSTGNNDLYNPCTMDSRLGTIRATLEKNLKDCPTTSLDSINGLHFHSLCEEDADALEQTALAFETKFKDIITHCKWLNFGGGHHITRPNYDIKRLCEIIEYFQKKYKLTVYLEPGEAVAEGRRRDQGPRRPRRRWRARAQVLSGGGDRRRRGGPGGARRASGGPRRARAVFRRLRDVLGAYPRDVGERLRGPAGSEPRGRGVTRCGLRRGAGGLRPGGRGVPPGRGGRPRGCD